MEKTISSDFIRGHIDTIILKSLFDGCKHTLEIAAYIEEKSGNQYEAKQATLYSALKRLENKKYVRPFWKDSPEGGRRRYFEVTPSGRKYAEQTLSQWDFSRDVIDILVDESPKLIIHKSYEPTEIYVNEKKSDSRALSENDGASANGKKIESGENTVSENNKNTVVEENRAEEHAKPAEPVQPENNVYVRQEQKADYDSALKRILEPSKEYDEVDYKRILNDIFDNNVKYEEKTETRRETAVKENDKPAETAVEQPKTEYVDQTESVNEKFESERIVAVSTSENERFQRTESSEYERSAKAVESVFDEDILMQPQRNNGKTDFTDLIEKVEAEGYKIRVSSGKNEKISGKILMNKANLIAALLTFLLVLVELLAISVVFRNRGIFGIGFYVAAAIIAAIVPVYTIIAYAKAPQLTKNSYSKNIIAAAFVVAFQLICIVFAVALLINTEFNNVRHLAIRIFIPVLAICDILAFFVIKEFMVHSRICLTK